MSSKNEEKKILLEYLSSIINIFSKEKNADKSSAFDYFKENIIIWIEEEEKNENKKITEVFSIIKYLISIPIKSNNNKKDSRKNIKKEKILNKSIEKANVKENKTKNEEEGKGIENNKIGIINKDPFNLFPIIFSVRPNKTKKYLPIFLSIIHQCICEENQINFPFLSKIFSECIICFFKTIKVTSENTISDPDLGELYSKLINFCLNLINTNEQIEQGFGCLLLSEIIEKCPLIKVKNNYSELWKIISKYLEDKWFLCKLDLLNCVISFIFVLENKFQPYANECLFRILDYLTDKDWMKRKISINIIYTLIFYCKNEITNVKQNIIDFLNIVKNDKVGEVRDICLQTLKLIEDEEKKMIKEKEEKERQEKERQEKEKIEKERQEKKRLEREKIEKEREEKERQEKEEKERKEKERLEKEKEEKERQEKEKLIREEYERKKMSKKNYKNRKNDNKLGSNKEKNKMVNNKNTTKYIYSKSGEKNLFKEKINHNKNKSNSIGKQKSSMKNSESTRHKSNELSKKMPNSLNNTQKNFRINPKKELLLTNNEQNEQSNIENIRNNLSFINSEKSIEFKSEDTSMLLNENNINKNTNNKEDNIKFKTIEIEDEFKNINKEEKKEIEKEGKINISNNNINNKDKKLKDEEKEKKTLFNEQNEENKNDEFYKTFLTNHSNTNRNNLTGKNKFAINKRNNDDINRSEDTKKKLIE